MVLVEYAASIKITIENIDQAAGNAFFVRGDTVESKNLTKTGEGSADLESLSIELGGIIINKGGSLIIGELIASTGNILAEAGTTTIDKLGASEMTVTVSADASHKVGAGSFASLANAGRVKSTGNLTVNGNSSGIGSIEASGRLTLSGTTGHTMGSITASASVKADSVTIAGGNASEIKGSLEIGILTLSNSSNLSVDAVLTTSQILVTGSALSSITLSADMALITADSIAGGASSTLNIVFTEAALAGMAFGEDNKFTLITLTESYFGEYIFTIEGVELTESQIIASLLEGESLEDGTVLWVGKTSYTVNVVTTDGSQSIVITEGERIPEPSTATLSLLALAGFLLAAAVSKPKSRLYWQS